MVLRLDRSTVTLMMTMVRVDRQAAVDAGRVGRQSPRCRGLASFGFTGLCASLTLPAHRSARRVPAWGIRHTMRFLLENDGTFRTGAVGPEGS
jgi:hypothetical protein